VDIARFLLGYSIYRGIETNITELLEATAKGGYNDVFKLVHQFTINNVDPSQFDPNEMLMSAVACGCEDVVLALLASGNCDLNLSERVHFRVQNTNISTRGTALAAASDPTVIKILLDNKADVNPNDSVSVLASSIFKLNVVAVKMLLDAGAEVGHKPTSNMTSFMELLRRATLKSGPIPAQVDVFNLLLKAGLRTRDIGGGAGAALTFTTTVSKSPSLLSALLEHDPSLLEARDRDGMTPLLSFVDRSNMDVVRRLLEAGADPTVCDAKGRTALMILASRKHDWSAGVNRGFSSSRAHDAFIGIVLDAILAQSHGLRTQPVNK
jgi:hypothetical protein